MAKKKKPKRKKTQKKSELQCALSVSDQAQLKDVRLIKTSCEQQPAAATGPKEFDIDYTTSVHTDKEKSWVLAIVNFDFFAIVDKDKEPVVNISATFLLTYTLQAFKGLKKQDFEAFANLNGVFNAWPYWREFVQNTIARMNLPPLTIPVFRITSPPKSPRQTKKAKKAKRKKKP